MRKCVYKVGWGGRGEQGFISFAIEIDNNNLIIYKR